MFDYQKNHGYFAHVPGDLEQLAQEELKSLGAGDLRPGFRGFILPQIKPPCIV